MPDDLARLEKKIGVLTRLVAIGLVADKSQQDQIKLLSIAGMAPVEIAELLGTTPNTVNVALSVLRKRGRIKIKSGGAKDE